MNDHEKHRLTLNMSLEEAQLLVDGLRLAVALRVREAADRAEESGGKPEYPLEIAMGAEQMQLAFIEGMSLEETLGTSAHRWGLTDPDASAPAIPQRAVRYAEEVAQEIGERRGHGSGPQT